MDTYKMSRMGHVVLPMLLAVILLLLLLAPITVAHALLVEYVITVENTENGTVAVNVNDSPVEKAEAGKTITIIPTPNDGYGVSKVTVSTSSSTQEITPVNGEYTFEMPAENVSVNVMILPKLTIELPDQEAVFTGGALPYDISKAVITCNGVPVEGYHDDLDIRYYDDNPNNDPGFTDAPSTVFYERLVIAYFDGDDTYAPSISTDMNPDADTYARYDIIEAEVTAVAKSKWVPEGADLTALSFSADDIEIRCATELEDEIMVFLQQAMASMINNDLLKVGLKPGVPNTESTGDAVTFTFVANGDELTLSQMRSLHLIPINSESSNALGLEDIIFDNLSIEFAEGDLVVGELFKDFPAAKTRTFDGSEQALINAGVLNDDIAALNYKIQYALGTANTAPVGGWDESIPTHYNAGTYYAWYRVLGSNSDVIYTSETPLEAKIDPIQVYEYDVILSNSEFFYTGSEQKPTVDVMAGNNPVPFGEYTVSYSNNTNVGDATVTVKHKENSNYSINVTKNFKIKYLPADAGMVDVQGGHTVGNKHWFPAGAEVTVRAAQDDYQISAAQNGTYGSDITISESNLKAYLKRISDGALTDIFDLSDYIGFDTVAPTGKLSLDAQNVWQTLTDPVTFELYRNGTPSIKIEAMDEESGIESIQYLIANEVLDSAALDQATDWKTYRDAVALQADGKYVIYAKLTDNTGNVSYLSSNGIVVDNVAPEFLGIEDDGAYYGRKVFKVLDNNNLLTFYVDGVDVTDQTGGDDEYTVPADNNSHTLRAVDKAGNTIEYTVAFYKNYTVTYTADDREIKTETVGHGKDATAPAVPAKVGYTGAWDKDGKNITADTAINAVYTINKYTVTYKADGKVVKTLEVEYGKDAAAPAVPAKEGYTGVWDKDGKNITADTTIVAVYTKQEAPTVPTEPPETTVPTEPPATTAPTEPSETTVPTTEPMADNPNVPGTGDNSILALSAVVMAVSLSTLLILLGHKRKYRA